MALEGMHRELLGHLRAKGALPSLVDDWESAWADALACPGELLPCPQCFLDGQTSRLEPLHRQGHIGQARCRQCRTVFLYSDG